MNEINYDSPIIETETETEAPLIKIEWNCGLPISWKKLGPPNEWLFKWMDELKRSLPN